MKDILQKYGQHKHIKNVSIVLVALIIALGINFLVIDSTPIGKKLKTNILENSENLRQSDMYAEKINDDIILKTSKEIQAITNLTISFIYNPETIKIKDVITGVGVSVDDLSNTPGVKTVMLNFDNPKDFKSGEDVLKLKVIKNSYYSEQLNITNVNFTDSSGQTFMMTTSGLIF